MPIQTKKRIQLTKPNVDTNKEQLKNPNTGIKDHFFVNVLNAMYMATNINAQNGN
mgnify:FL=1